jgi:hypothetical protein
VKKWKYVHFIILTMTCSDGWTLLLSYLKYLLNINFECVYCVLLIKLIILMRFLPVEWQTWWVSDTRPKLDRYGYEFLPMGMCTDMNFYLWPFYWRTDKYSTQSKPDPLPSLIVHCSFEVVVHWYRQWQHRHFIDTGWHSVTTSELIPLQNRTEQNLRTCINFRTELV